MNAFLSVLWIAVGFSLCVGSAMAQFVSKSPGFESSLLGPPAEWTGDVFKANYAFPSTTEDMSSQPWMILDPRKPRERDQYYAAVLSYGLTAFSGDIFDGCTASGAGWYHAPWMTLSFGNSPSEVAIGKIGSGREPICGLTQERPAPQGYLHTKQTRDKVQSWAVGVFNRPGGYVLGQIWRDQWTADMSDLKYPDGTFIVKFLFTEATELEVPYLKGSPTWKANIYKQEGSIIRETKPMRLIQVDFAIRDKRMDFQTGWVFGTFMYANPDGSTPAHWSKNLVPVGVMWGNDPGKTNSLSFTEQALNPLILKMRDDKLLFDLTKRHDFGWKDRVNGPVDNPDSSCLSCHGSAQVHRRDNIKQFITPVLKPGAASDANKMLWFRNIKAGETFVFTKEELGLIDQRTPSKVRADWTLSNMSEFISTDYSLQVRMGIENSRAYANLLAIAAVNRLKQQSPKAFTNKATVLDEVDAEYKRESRQIERAGTHLK